MEKDVRTLKALADENRLRLLLLLGQRELFVCQLMAVLGISQPLVSRSLALLDREGLLESRRSGKQVFYRLRTKLPPLAAAVLAALPAQEGCFARDRQSLELFCREFQHGTSSCDMDTVRKFIDFKNKNQKQGAAHGKTRQKSVR
ncbi:MAG: metalloregulator ArsR/SmtB family transcription factor [Acidobacteria bacterium]|jgi:ArsR family transcriptional regulator|nr:metalloregulator ArsR/SmtB family transcription factor [Acidobacteriota bacterium]